MENISVPYVAFPKQVAKIKNELIQVLSLQFNEKNITNYMKLSIKYKANSNKK